MKEILFRAIIAMSKVSHYKENCCHYYRMLVV